MASYYRVTIIRRLLLLAAWCMVLCAVFVIPSVHTETLAFRPGEETYAGWLVILSDTLGGLFRISTVSTGGIAGGIRLAVTDPTQNRLLLLSDILSCIAHLCFLFTPIAVLVKPQSLVARFYRYFACSLTFFWSFSFLNYLHPMVIGLWNLKPGFYVMGAGYMLAMVSVWITPKHPEAAERISHRETAIENP